MNVQGELLEIYFFEIAVKGVNILQVLLKNGAVAMLFNNQLVCFFEAFYGGNDVLLIMMPQVQALYDPPLVRVPPLRTQTISASHSFNNERHFSLLKYRWKLTYGSNISYNTAKEIFLFGLPKRGLFSHDLFHR